MFEMSDFSVFVFPYDRASRGSSVQAYMDTAQQAETLGYYSVSLPFATRQAPTIERAEGAFDRSNPDRLVMLDPMLLAPLLVHATKDIRIGMHSASLPLLHPYHWARFFSTLDVMSGGRIDAGMCLGGIPAEFKHLGLPKTKRGKISDETLEVIARLWLEDEVNFRGTYVQIEGATLDPMPVQRPHPPIWWGGGVAGVPRAARHCQYILPVAPTPAFLAEELVPAVAAETAKTGTTLKLGALVWAEIVVDDRDVKTQILPGYETFQHQPGADLVGSPEAVATGIRALREAGLGHFILDFNRHGLDPLSQIGTQMELFVSEVLPLLID
jgi:alkanesulfonate monooxygenase SsuD/methylene tetrahydromethanopterin reductase-like flavin-dependent oxidoreductase (luciferase family)